MSYLPPTSAPAPAPAQPSHSFTDRIIGAVKLSRPIYDEVRRDPSAMMQAAGIVAVTGLLSGISQFAEVRGQVIDYGDGTYTVPDTFLGPLVAGIAVAVLAFVVWIISAILFRFVGTKIIKTPAEGIQWQEVARPLGFASAPSLLLLLSPIPIIGGIVISIVGLWGLAAQIVAMSETFRCSKLRAFGVMLVSSIVLAIVLIPIVCLCTIVAGLAL